MSNNNYTFSTIEGFKNLRSFEYSNSYYNPYPSPYPSSYYNPYPSSYSSSYYNPYPSLYSSKYLPGHLKHSKRSIYRDHRYNPIYTTKSIYKKHFPSYRGQKVRTTISTICHSTKVEFVFQPNRIKFGKKNCDFFLENEKNYTTDNNTIVIDGRNVIHANGSFTNSDTVTSITASNSRRVGMLFSNLLNKLSYKKIIIVLSQEYSMCDNIAKNIHRQYLLSSAKPASLQIFEYIGKERFKNGDDIVALKLAQKLEADLLSNDRMDKDEDFKVYQQIDIDDPTQVREHTCK